MGIIKNILYTISAKNSLPLFKNQTVFPYYHLVRNNQVAHIENLYQFKNVAGFKNDLDVLVKNYQPIHPNDLLEKKELKNKFLISFDDGLEEIYSVIYPILKERNLNAVFFINPVFVDNNEGLYKHYISIIISHLKKSGFEPEKLQQISKLFSFQFASTAEFIQKFKNIKFSEREKVNEVLNLLNIDIQKYLKEHKLYISKEQIREMMDDGFYFGGHTMSHPPLSQLSHQEQKDEIINSIEWLKRNFGITYSMFAFPFSDSSATKKLMEDLFEYDTNILIFGNAGFKKDIDSRIIQRLSFENPVKQVEKHIVAENFYKVYNKATSNYFIKRK
jgi:peptidoglycan/xylan/chitin deacetylase (PgdA/CDA1 family)